MRVHPVLAREEYIEQAHFFRIYRLRQQENVAAQELLNQAIDEVLASTRLPMVLEFLRGELLATGGIAEGMARLPHYFTPFQTFVMQQAEREVGRFEQQFALAILEREADYRAESPVRAGLFFYQFESLARNRLGYQDGITAIRFDPMYDDDWREWLGKLVRLIGTVEFPELVYRRSEFFAEEQKRTARRSNPADDAAASSSDGSPTDPSAPRSVPVLFGAQEGRIAKANRGKDPLYFFAALQRQLGYPAVPRPKTESAKPIFHPALEARLQRIEKQIAFLDMEQKGEVDWKALTDSNERSEPKS